MLKVVSGAITVNVKRPLLKVLSEELVDRYCRSGRRSAFCRSAAAPAARLAATTSTTTSSAAAFRLHRGHVVCVVGRCHATITPLVANEKLNRVGNDYHYCLGGGVAAFAEGTLLAVGVASRAIITTIILQFPLLRLLTP